MAELFASDLDTERLIMGLEIYAGRKINPDSALLILMKYRKFQEHWHPLNIFMKMRLSITLYVPVHCWG